MHDFHKGYLDMEVEVGGGQGEGMGGVLLPIESDVNQDY